jgi:hypothetical protein
MPPRSGIGAGMSMPKTSPGQADFLCNRNGSGSAAAVREHQYD